MDYGSAKRFVKKIGIKSFRYWVRYSQTSDKATSILKARKGKFKGELVFRSGEFKGLPIRPDSLPKAPQFFYSEFKGWNKFLGKKK